MPGPFERGFSPFGRQVPIRGQQAPAPLAAAAPPPPAPPPAMIAPAPVPQPQARPGPSAPIRVYKKGEPGAPPCPVCRG